MVAAPFHNGVGTSAFAIRRVPPSGVPSRSGLYRAGLLSVSIVSNRHEPLSTGPARARVPRLHDFALQTNCFCKSLGAPLLPLLPLFPKETWEEMLRRGRRAGNTPTAAENAPSGSPLPPLSRRAVDTAVEIAISIERKVIATLVTEES